MTKNKAATFLWAKREPDMPWFSLVGVVANSGGVDEDGDPAPHQSFLIGDECTIEIKPGKSPAISIASPTMRGAFISTTKATSR